MQLKPMLRIFLLFLFSLVLLTARNIDAEYRVEFGIFGEVAKVHATLTSDHKYYSINATVVAVGSIAKTVTDNLKERHISKGHIERGLLVTDLYQMIKSYGEYTNTTIYTVNHRKKSVTRHYKEWKQGVKIKDKKVTLGYYSKDDMLTLFLNLPKHIKEKYKSRHYTFKAVGADRRNGRVDMTVPSQKSLKKMGDLLGKVKEGDWYSTVVMHRKLYHSQKGELEVKMNKEGIVDKAVLKDLVFFGDVRIIRQ
ncbi:MAG: hypothetical protein COB07_11155 [Sulfurovum sp.]|nr:MAG: hypothetical protein COB07_11155 [Sulfurovum sp.]